VKIGVFRHGAGMNAGRVQVALLGVMSALCTYERNLWRVRPLSMEPSRRGYRWLGQSGRGRRIGGAEASRVQSGESIAHNVALDPGVGLIAGSESGPGTAGKADSALASG
jgi:hypothetical protein